jgi:predicted DNA-binding WGR domain protein
VRRFEYIRGNQAKFWEVVRKGAVLTTASGKVGKPPKKKTKQLVDYMAAEQEFDRLIRDHLRRGYIEVEEPTEVDTGVADRHVVLRMREGGEELELKPAATRYIVWRMVEVEIMDNRVPPPDLQRWAYRASRRLRLEEIPDPEHPKFEQFVDMFMELSEPDRAAEIGEATTVAAYKLADGSEWIVTAKEAGVLAEASMARMPKRHKITASQETWMADWTDFNRRAADKGGYLVELISED